MACMSHTQLDLTQGTVTVHSALTYNNHQIRQQHAFCTLPVDWIVPEQLIGASVGRVCVTADWQAGESRVCAAYLQRNLLICCKVSCLVNNGSATSCHMHEARTRCMVGKLRYCVAYACASIMHGVLCTSLCVPWYII